MASTNRIFITHIDELDGERVSLLHQFLSRGGGIAWFLNSPSDQKNLNALKEKHQTLVLPFSLGNIQTSRFLPKGRQKLSRGEFNSPFLSLFKGSGRGDLNSLEFYQYRQASETGKGQILLRYTDDTPAMATHHYDLGRILYLNFSADDLWSNLGRQPLYPAWIQVIAKALKDSQRGQSAHLVGQSVEIELWKADVTGRSLISPSGKITRMDKQLNGDRITLNFSPKEQGFYRLGSKNTSYISGINCARGESDLSQIKISDLFDSQSNLHNTHVVHGQMDYQTIAQGQSTYQWFLFALLALLFLEPIALLLFQRMSR